MVGGGAFLLRQGSASLVAIDSFRGPAPALPTYSKKQKEGEHLWVFGASVCPTSSQVGPKSELTTLTIFTAWKVLPFAVIWIPRVIEEILGNTVKAYFVAVLLGIFRKQHSLKELIDEPFHECKNNAKP